MTSVSSLPPTPLNERTLLSLLCSNSAYSRTEAKRLLSSLSSNTAIMHQPRSVILCLTLKITVYDKLDGLVRYSFGMIRGLFKEMVRSQSGGANFRKVRTWERSQENTLDTEDDNAMKKIVHSYRNSVVKSSVVRSRSRPDNRISNGIEEERTGKREENVVKSTRIVHERTGKGEENRMVWEKNGIGQERTGKGEENGMGLKKRLLVSIAKTFRSQLGRLFARLKKPLVSAGTGKKTALQRLTSLLSKKVLKSSFSNILHSKKLPEPRRSLYRSRPQTKSVSLISEDSQFRSPSFEVKDKELWRRRHPIRKHSPSPSEYSRPSMLANSQYSESNSPRNPFSDNPFFRPDGRRNTEKIRKLETFGTVSSDEVKDLESLASSKEEEKVIMKKKAPQKLRSGKGRNENKGTDEKKINEEKNLERGNKVKKMVGNIGKNLRACKKQTVDVMKKAVQDDKMNQKTNAANLISDLLTFTLNNHKKRSLKDAFDSILTQRLETPKPISLSKPAKKALRSGKTPNLKPQAESFIQKLDFLNTYALKNKLISFVSIIEEGENTLSTENPALKSSLRNIFRILESKRFNKLCRTFTAIRRKASQSKSLQQKRKLKQLSALNRLCHKFSKRNQALGLKAILKGGQRNKAINLLLRNLTRLTSRIRKLNQPLGFFLIKSYAKERDRVWRIRILRLKSILKRDYSRRIARAFA
jgi:hypothetical protein